MALGIHPSLERLVSRVFGCSFPNPCAFLAKSYYLEQSVVPLSYERCNSSNHDVNSYPCYACYVHPNFASSRDTIDVVLTFPNQFYPSAQCTSLEMVKPFGIDARLDAYDECTFVELRFDLMLDNHVFLDPLN